MSPATSSPRISDSPLGEGIAPPVADVGPVHRSCLGLHDHPTRLRPGVVRGAHPKDFGSTEAVHQHSLTNRPSLFMPQRAVVVVPPILPPETDRRVDADGLMVRGSGGSCMSRQASGVMIRQTSAYDDAA